MLNKDIFAFEKLSPKSVIFSNETYTNIYRVEIRKYAKIHRSVRAVSERRGSTKPSSETTPRRDLAPRSTGSARAEVVVDRETAKVAPE